MNINQKEHKELGEVKALLKENEELFDSMQKKIGEDVKEKDNAEAKIKELELEIRKEANNSQAILSCAVKGMHAGYQAVVHGKKAKWSAIHAYAEKLSRVDLPQYWKMIGAMTDAERVQFNRRVARLVARSG